ncbi:MAG: TetR/AcrR family transcriptional regulator [Gammaproteobacteria bacterium]|nr:TetR/AcrR family transcriptional regulator [Gammaproteobacteria bacterium]
MSTPREGAAAPLSNAASGTAPPFGSPSDCACPPQCAKDRILQAAQNLFYEHGIRAVSVDAIAAEADTTKVTLYRVFESKDALIAECLKDQTRRFWQWWEAIVDAHQGQPRAQIEALFDLLANRICRKEAHRGCPIANSAVELDDPAHPAAHVIREHHAEIAKRFRKLCKEMGAREPNVLGDALTLLVTGVFSARIAFENAEQVKSVAEAAKALLDSPALGAPEAAKAQRAKAPRPKAP